MRVFEIYGKYRNKKLLRLNVKIDALKKQKDEYIEQLQQTCVHENVVECEYRTFASGGSSLPPKLMCLNCGLEADGWHWDKKG